MGGAVNGPDSGKAIERLRVALADLGYPVH
jgi:hypothetical protein